LRTYLYVAAIAASALVLAVPATPAFAGMGGHAAITITSNADFSACGCVTSGNGTAASPFVIGPWSIAAPSGGTSGWSVKIDNTFSNICYTTTNIAGLPPSDCKG
jgi:hypothetical protein